MKVKINVKLVSHALYISLIYAIIIPSIHRDSPFELNKVEEKVMCSFMMGASHLRKVM